MLKKSYIFLPRVICHLRAAERRAGLGLPLLSLQAAARQVPLEEPFPFPVGGGAAAGVLGDLHQGVRQGPGGRGCFRNYIGYMFTDFISDLTIVRVEAAPGERGGEGALGPAHRGEGGLPGAGLGPGHPGVTVTPMIRTGLFRTLERERKKN